MPYQSQNDCCSKGPVEKPAREGGSMRIVVEQLDHRTSFVHLMVEESGCPPLEYQMYLQKDEQQEFAQMLQKLHDFAKSL